MLTAPSVLTLGDVARRLNVATWQVRRLFERGFLPPAARMGLYRVVAIEDLAAIKAALRRAGYLPDDAEPEGGAA